MGHFREREKEMGEAWGREMHNGRMLWTRRRSRSSPGVRRELAKVQTIIETLGREKEVQDERTRGERA